MEAPAVTHGGSGWQSAMHLQIDTLRKVFWLKVEGD